MDKLITPANAKFLTFILLLIIFSGLAANNFGNAPTKKITTELLTREQEHQIKNPKKILTYNDFVNLQTGVAKVDGIVADNRYQALANTRTVV